MSRRMREEGTAALQRFSEDFLPLILPFAVSITGYPKVKKSEATDENVCTI